MTGEEVDRAARSVVTEAGYPEYVWNGPPRGADRPRQGRDVGTSLGALWETPFYRLEAGQIYTIEPGLAVPGYGYIGIEEDILVTENGMEWLSDPQTSLIVR